MKEDSLTQYDQQNKIIVHVPWCIRKASVEDLSNPRLNETKRGGSVDKRVVHGTRERDDRKVSNDDSGVCRNPVREALRGYLLKSHEKGVTCVVDRRKTVVAASSHPGETLVLPQGSYGFSPIQ